MSARIRCLAILVTGLCVGSGCALVLGIDDIEKPASLTTPDTDSSERASSEAGGGWCDRNGAGHLVCEDFDRAGPPRLSPFIELGGKVTAEEGSVSSPPRALVAVCNSSSSSSATAAASWSSASAIATLAIAFDVAIEATSDAQQVLQFVKFIFHDGRRTTEVGLGISQGKGGYGFEYQDQDATYSQFIESFTLPTGTWVRVAFAIHTSTTGSATVDVDVDGTSVAKGVALLHPLRPGAVDALLGIGYVPSSHPQRTVRVDNVVIDGT